MSPTKKNNINNINSEYCAICWKIPKAFISFYIYSKYYYTIRIKTNNTRICFKFGEKSENQLEYLKQMQKNNDK
jgi:hypothetical protein